MQVPLSHQIDIVGFHNEATRLLAQQVPPETVEWSAPQVAQVDRQLQEAARAQIGSRAARAIIPQSFVRMSELVVLHRDADRFDLLYRSLWRLVYEPELKNDLGDVDLARLRQMAQAVRRDMHKMKSRMEFQPMLLKGQPTDVCWYEPAHFIAESIGAWLVQRNAQSRWLLLTPDRSLLWDGERLLAAPGLAPGEHPGSVPATEWPAVLEAQPWL